jgi:hypothetical protein
VTDGDLQKGGRHASDRVGQVWRIILNHIVGLDFGAVIGIANKPSSHLPIIYVPEHHNFCVDLKYNSANSNFIFLV